SRGIQQHNFSKISQRAGRNDRRCREENRRTERRFHGRMFSKLLSHGAHSGTITRGKIYALLASTNSAKRWRDCAWPGRRGELEGLIAMPVDKKRVHEKQEDEIIDRTAPPGEVIYEAGYAEGEHELERNSLALAFSGLAAGLSMGFSMVTEGILQHHLPNTTWQPLITKLGYSVGFLVVTLGRQQLFTKNTLTVILPLLRERKIDIVFNVARLWVIVLVGNLIRAFVFAWLAANSNIFSSEIRDTFSKIGQSSMQADFWTIVIRAAVAGWFIALMVWLLPFAES